MTIEEVSITPEKPGECFGRIRYGFIKLTGNMIGPINIKTFYGKATIVNRIGKPPKIGYIRVALDIPNMDEDYLYFVPIQKYILKNTRGPDTTKVMCLLRMNVPEKGPDVYQRCGSLDIWDKEKYIIEDTDRGRKGREDNGWALIETTITVV